MIVTTVQHQSASADCVMPRRRNATLIAPCVALLVLMVLFTAGCSSSANSDEQSMDHAHEAPAPTNRVDIPAPVRRNLGITFATVERRTVANTMRVPGRFEWLPTARREYRTPLEGRVEIMVEQYQTVEPGTVLYRLDSPQWRDMQQQIEETMAILHISDARLTSLAQTMEAHEIHEQGLREAIELWAERVEQIEQVTSAGGGRAAELAQARISLNEAKSAFGEVREKHAELQLRQHELESEQRSAASRLELLLRSAASILGHPRIDIDAPASTGRVGESRGEPLWKATDRVEIRATAPGVVEQLPVTHGAWAERGDMVLSVVDPTAVRFRAVGLQSDLGRLRSGLGATIVPPRAGEWNPHEAVTGRLELGLQADPDQRTIDLIVHPSELTGWTRAGVSALLEITLEESSPMELAIPLSCVVRDGLKPVIFRRDPSNPNQVIKLNADVGLDDGRWIAIESGVREGDEIVLDGAYQLMLATSGTTQRGGHFHADGTFHADDH